MKGPFLTERAMLVSELLAYFLLRCLTMNLSVRLFLRVFRPLASWPQGEHGWRPPEVRPSPPPIGWSTGFMVTPRLCGRRPSQRVRPALPSDTRACRTLLTWPTVARQLRWTEPHLGGRQTHVRVVAFLGHQLRGRAGGAHELAALADLHFDVVDHRAGRDVAQRQRVAGLDVGGARRTITSRRLRGRRAPGCSASRHPCRCSRARRALRFGSYSIDADLGRHADLVALEVDHAVAALVSAAAETRGDATRGCCGRRSTVLALEQSLRSGVLVGRGRR